MEKCARYWPGSNSNGTEIFGNFEVKKLTETRLKSIDGAMLRKLLITGKLSLLCTHSLSLTPVACSRKL